MSAPRLDIWRPKPETPRPELWRGFGAWALKHPPGEEEARQIGEHEEEAR